ncbi:MAG: zinc-ribbon domain-containing protein [Eubacterium sp.]|jgi:hypothetical protein|nr:zinc-ribbon domain-containing protein [Eubacterium sp.]
MFCRNCGKPISEEDKFCASCGASVGDIVTNVAISTALSDYSYVWCLISTVFIIISLFMPHHIFLFVYGGYDFNGLPFSALSFLIRLGGFAHTAHVGIMLVVLSVFWVVCIVRAIMFFYALIAKYERIPVYGAKATNWLLIYTCSIWGLTLFFILAEKIATNRLRSGSLSGLDSIQFIMITGHLVTFLLFIGTIIAKATYFRRLKRVVWMAYNGGPSFNGHRVSAVAVRQCENCRHEYAKSRSTCPQCGHRNKALWVCSQCDTHNDPSQIICKNCGHFKS